MEKKGFVYVPEEQIFYESGREVWSGDKDLELLKDSEVNDEDLTRYYRFGAG